MQKVPLHYYQMVLMDQAFYGRDIPGDQIAWYMHAALPQKYSQALGKIMIEKEQLKKEIILGGSSAYDRRNN